MLLANFLALSKIYSKQFASDSVSIRLIVDLMLSIDSLMFRGSDCTIIVNNLCRLKINLSIAKLTINSVDSIFKIISVAPLGSHFIHSFGFDKIKGSKNMINVLIECPHWIDILNTSCQAQLMKGGAPGITAKCLQNFSFLWGVEKIINWLDVGNCWYKFFNFTDLPS